MAYIKFKELTKYFDLKREVKEDDLPEYAKEYVDDKEKIILSEPYVSFIIKNKW